MNIQTIKRLQKENGLEELQNWIDSGTAWRLEGSVGRAAMDALESGACMLPLVPHRDYWGNRVPARKELKDGTKGTYRNSVRFWTNHSNTI
jgi:hypothetical protein